MDKNRFSILTVKDNGRGIVENEIKDNHSPVLLDICERASQWGGEVIICGVPGKGTTVTVQIPLPASLVNGGK